MRRWLRIGVTLATAAALAQPARAQSPAPSAWEVQVQAMLDRRASAVERGDERAFVDTMRGAPRAFADGRRTWFRRLRALPLGTYRLELFRNEFGDLATPADARRYGGEVHVVQVKERVSFRGLDRAPTYEDLFLTVRNDGQGWSVVSDTDREELFLLSMRNLWDFGPVEIVQRDRIMVVVHPAQRDVAGTILAAAQQARTTTKSRWPYPWSDPIVIMVPSTVDELARILQTQFDLSAFVAFASSSVDRTRGWALSGDRVFLHWPNFSRYGSSFQQRILAHEFLHLATRATTGPFVPAFMDEGIAQYYGENERPGPRPEERRRIRNGTFSRRVPADWQFTVGSNSDIFLSYELSDSFVTYLGARFDSGAGARVYRALAAESPVSPGTSLYHVERAFRATFRVSFEDLERGWAAREESQLR